MDNVQKHTKAACGHMFKHYERARELNPETGQLEYVKFGNQQINPERSHLNYNLAAHQTMRQGDFIRKRCSEVKLQNRKDFGDSRQNLIITLHLHDDLMLHYKLKSIAVQELSPILTVLLEQGIEEGSIKMEYPKESAEIIVSVLTVFLDNTLQEGGSLKKKLKIFSNVLETCLHTQKGSFDFLFDTLDEEYM